MYNPGMRRNTIFLAGLALGGLALAQQLMFWWEVDVGYYIIRLLASMGLVWDVRNPPPGKTAER